MAHFGESRKNHKFPLQFGTLKATRSPGLKWPLRTASPQHFPSEVGPPSFLIPSWDPALTPWGARHAPGYKNPVQSHLPPQVLIQGKAQTPFDLDWTLGRAGDSGADMAEDISVSRAPSFPGPAMPTLSPACSCPLPLRLQSGDISLAFCGNRPSPPHLPEVLPDIGGAGTHVLCLLPSSFEPHKADKLVLTKGEWG